MARKEARISTKVWRSDFTDLPLACQGLYWMLLSQPDVSMCGVLPYLPGRWASMCGSADIDRALELLEQSGRIVVDTATSEVLIRTFVKWDGVLRSPKTRNGMWSAWHSILSDNLRIIVADQASEWVDEASSEGWLDLSDIPSRPLDSTQNTLPDRVSDTLNGSRNGVPDRGSPRARAASTTSTSTSVTKELAGKPATTVDVEGFDESVPVAGDNLTEDFTKWAETEGFERPADRTPSAQTRWLMGLVDDVLGSAKYSHGARMTLIGEWAVAAGAPPLESEGWGHLARLVKAAGGVDAFEAMHTATTSGAGLDGKWRDDPRALTKYARAVLSERLAA